MRTACAPATLREERFFERLYDFVHRHGKIEQRFQNRLSSTRISSFEHYINDRFGIIIDFKRSGETDTKIWALCVHACPALVDEGTAILATGYEITFKFNDIRGGNQQSVLVNIIKLVQGPDIFIIGFVRFYHVKDELL